MKKKDRKIIEEKLESAIKQLLKENKTDVTAKVEKIVKKSVKQILKKAGRKNTALTPKKKSAEGKNKQGNKGKTTVTYKNIKTAAAKKSLRK